jgi:ABC-2 type transport system ATP-binding protein
MFQAHDLTERYGGTVAVGGDLFTTRPVAVTGFPDPKGVGHVAAMLMIGGVDSPTAERVVDHL